MNIKMMFFGAMALSIAAGSAFAAGETGGKSALDDQVKMKPFYTDSTMKTMVGEDDFMKAWKALTPEDQAAISAACDDEAKNANPVTSHAEFCKMKGNANGN